MAVPIVSNATARAAEAVEASLADPVSALAATSRDVRGNVSALLDAPVGALRAEAPVDLEH
jgi:hypothetical protein